MTVYVIHAPRESYDVSRAAEFGELKPLFDRGDWPGMFPEGAAAKLDERLVDFDPDEDYLLWAGGDALALLLVGAVLAGYRVKWLRPDRKLDADGNRTRAFSYFPVEVDLPAGDAE